MSTGQLLTKPRCPKCRTLLDGYTPVADSESRPQAGHVSVCAYCLQVLVFCHAGRGARLTLRLPTTQEAEEMRRDPELAQTKAAMIALNRKLGRDMK